MYLASSSSYQLLYLLAAMHFTQPPLADSICPWWNTFTVHHSSPAASPEHHPGLLSTLLSPPTLPVVHAEPAQRHTLLT